MSQTLKDLLNDSFERHADRTAVRVLRRPESARRKEIAVCAVDISAVESATGQIGFGPGAIGIGKGTASRTLTRWRSGVCAGLSILRYARIIGSADLQ